MALTGVLRPGHVVIRVLEMEPALRALRRRARSDRGGARQEEKRVFLKAWDEHDHHSVVLREADEAGLDYMGWKVDSPVTLKKLAADIETSGLCIDLEWIPADEHPKTGERFRFTIPTGHVMELYAEKEYVGNNCGTDGQNINPDPWPDGLHGIAASRFDHCLLVRRRPRRHGEAVHSGARLQHRREGGDRANPELHDRRLPDLLEQGARRGLRPPAGEGQVPPRVVRTRQLGKGAARGRHPVAHQDLDRHRPDAPRHHARRDDLLLRSFGQPQRGLLPAATSTIRTGRSSPGTTKRWAQAIFYHDRKLNEAFLSVFT